MMDMMKKIATTRNNTYTIIIENGLLYKVMEDILQVSSKKYYIFLIGVTLWPTGTSSLKSLPNVLKHSLRKISHNTGFL